MILRFIFRLILGLLGIGVAGAAVGAISYVVCKIVVASLSSNNIKQVSKDAIKNRDNAEAKKLIGKALSAVVKKKAKEGNMHFVTLDMLDSGNKVAEVTINSHNVSDDVYVGKRYNDILI